MMTYRNQPVVRCIIMKERTLIIIRLFGTQIFLVPLLICLALAAGPYQGQLLLISLTVLFITLFTGYWEFFSRYFKWIYGLILGMVILSILLLGKSKPVAPFTIIRILLLCVQAYLLFQLSKIILTILEKPKNAYEIESPFAEGTYMVTDGGNSRLSRLMNYHYYSASHRKSKTHFSMLYATDIVKLSENSKRFLPLRNEDYPIFNESLFSPMEGVVFKVTDGIADNQPFSGPYPYNVGNSVVIRNGPLFFLFGHLKQHSITVKEGDLVTRGQVIASIGNSGWTERPHLHMQLMTCSDDNFWHGMGRAITYKERMLFKNRIIRIMR